MLIWSGVKPVTLLWRSLMGDEEEQGRQRLHRISLSALNPVSSHFNRPLILMHVNIIYWVFKVPKDNIWMSKCKCFSKEWHFFSSICNLDQRATMSFTERFLSAISSMIFTLLKDLVALQRVSNATFSYLVNRDERL